MIFALISEPNMNPRHRLFALFVGVAALGAFLMACPAFGAFTFSEESDEITVESPALASTPLTDVFPARIPMEVELEEELAKQDASGASSVTLRELYFEITENSDKQNFDFLDDIVMRVSSRESDSDLPEEDLAWRDPIPRGENQFHLDIDEDLDLKPYAEQGLRLRTNVSGSAPSSDAKFKVFAEFRVDTL